LGEHRRQLGLCAKVGHSVAPGARPGAIPGMVSTPGGGINPS
jgi:hypothetical protein